MKKKGLILLCAAVFLLCAAAGALALRFLPRGVLNPAGPEAAVQALLDTSTPEAWRERFCAGSRPAVTEFEDAEAVAGAVFDRLRTGEPLTFRLRADAGSAREPVYLLSAGGADLFQVQAVWENGVWDVSRLTVPTELLEVSARDVTLLAPPDAALTLNGLPVSEAYITDDRVLYDDMTALEGRFADPPRRVRYTIPGVYGDVTVEASREGGLTPVSADGDSWVWTVPDAGAYSFSVLAPEGAVVTVCGAVLTEADAAGQTPMETKLDIPEANAALLPRYTMYEARGLYTPPEISAVDAGGAALTPRTAADGSVTFPPNGDEALRQAYEPQLAQFLQSLANYSIGHIGSRAGALAVTLPNSQLYDYIVQATSSLSWVGGFSLYLAEISSSDYLPLGDDAFICRARMLCNTTSYYQTVDLDLHYEFLWVLTENGWRLADMAFL